MRLAWRNLDKDGIGRRIHGSLDKKLFIGGFSFFVFSSDADQEGRLEGLLKWFYHPKK